MFGTISTALLPSGVKQFWSSRVVIHMPVLEAVKSQKWGAGSILCPFKYNPRLQPIYEIWCHFLLEIPPRSKSDHAYILSTRYM